MGRQRELAHLAAVFDTGASLVTLVGPPGIGKTRLARRYLLSVRSREAVFCDLRSVASFPALCEALARRLDIRLGDPAAATDPTRAIAEGLSARGPVCLVLDNFDEADPASNRGLLTWLQRNPDLRLLVTSRRLLKLPGERPIELGPLTLPTNDHDHDCEAVRLFLERSQTAEPSFQATRGLTDIHELVRLVEGLPLAIELAAGLMKRISPRRAVEIVRETALDFSPAVPHADPRHATLRVAIDSIWKQLTPEEQGAAAQLSVFRRGFSLNAARYVIGPNADRHVEALRDASVLRRADEDSEPRWDMYEAIRKYAVEQLTVGAVRTNTQARHAEYYCREGKRWIASLSGPGSPAARTTLQRELENLSSAFDYARDAESACSMQIGELALIVSFVLHEQTPAQAVAVLDAALEYPLEADLRLRLLLKRAETHRNLGQPQKAKQTLEEAHSIDTRDRAVQALRALETARLEYFQGNFVRTRPQLDAAITYAEESGDKHVEGLALKWMAWFLAEAELDPEAFEYYEKAVDCLRIAGDPHAITAATVPWAGHRLFFQRGGVREDFEAFVREAERTGDRLNEVRSWLCLGIFDLENGNVDFALREFENALRIAQSTRLLREEAQSTMWLAVAQDEHGDLAAAQLLYERALQLATESASRRLGALCRVYFSGSIARAGDVPRARRMLESVLDYIAEWEDRALRPIAELMWSQIEWAEARSARHRGAVGRAMPLENRARQRINRARRRSRRGALADGGPPLVERSEASRIIVRQFDKDARRSNTAVLNVWTDALRFQLDDQRPVSLERSPTVQKVLQALIEDHRRGATGLSADALFERAWPGQKTVSGAGANRVQNVIKRLRRAGLTGALLTRDGRYALDPNLSIRAIEAPLES